MSISRAKKQPGTAPGGGAARFSVSLARGLAILGAFSPGRPTLGIAELAALLDMSGATVHRYVRTLEHLGYLAQDEATRRYRLRARFAELGAATVESTTIRDLAAPILRRLSQEAGQTVSLAVLEGVEVVFIDRVLAPVLNLDLHVGSRLPAYCTSLGKAVLAFLPADELAVCLREVEFVKRGPNTLSTRSLMQDLDRVRSLGYAVNNEELGYGLRSIAAPIRSSTGAVVAAVNVAVHASRFSITQVVARYAPLVTAAARDISRELGFRPARQRTGPKSG